ncbi:MAG: CsbD family protein [Amaricoccus sp.]
MDRIVTGAANKAGTVKEAAGKLTGDKQLEGEGKGQKAAGMAESAVGKAKDTVREVTK